MDKTSVKIKIKTHDNKKIERTITNHKGLEDLKNQIEIFLKESNEAIITGHQLSVVCSTCCNGISLKNCLKTTIKTGNNKLSIV